MVVMTWPTAISLTVCTTSSTPTVSLRLSSANSGSTWRAAGSKLVTVWTQHTHSYRPLHLCNEKCAMALSDTINSY